MNRSWKRIGASLMVGVMVIGLIGIRTNSVNAQKSVKQMNKHMHTATATGNAAAQADELTWNQQEQKVAFKLSHDYSKEILANLQGVEEEEDIELVYSYEGSDGYHELDNEGKPIRAGEYKVIAIARHKGTERRTPEALTLQIQEVQGFTDSENVKLKHYIGGKAVTLAGIFSAHNNGQTIGIHLNERNGKTLIPEYEAAFREGTFFNLSVLDYVIEKLYADGEDNSPKDSTDKKIKDSDFRALLPALLTGETRTESFTNKVLAALGCPTNVGLSIEWLSLTTAEIHMNFRVSYGNGQYWLPIVKHPTSRNLVYDGSEQMLVEGEWETNPKVNQANYYAVTTEEKSIDELEWTVLPKGGCPKATDAGVYHIYYKAVKDLGNKGYFVAYWVGTTVIAPAEFDYSLPQAKDLTYNGKEQELVTPPEEGTYTVTYSLDQKEYEEAIPTAKDAGKYTVFYKISNGSNYIEVTGQVEVEIKAVNNGGTTVTVDTYVYPAPVEEKTNPEENNTKPEEENTNLEEEETPLTEEPEVVEETDEEMTDIEEAEVAKDEKPHLKEKEVAPVSDIGDDEVPLSDNPVTGDVLPIMWICLGVLALIGLGGILVVKRKEE